MSGLSVVASNVLVVGMHEGDDEAAGRGLPAALAAIRELAAGALEAPIW